MAHRNKSEPRSHVTKLPRPRPRKDDLLIGEKCLVLAAPVLGLVGAIPAVAFAMEYLSALPLPLALPLSATAVSAALALLVIALLRSLRMRLRWEAVIAFLIFMIGAQVVIGWWYLNAMSAA